MVMNVTCNDRDRIFEDGTLAEWAALEAHAASCADCADELRSWKSLSVAAQEMREYAESPALWPRIERVLAEEAARNTRRARRWSWLSFWRDIPLAWQAAAAGAFVLILTVSAGWFYLHPAKFVPAADQSLLKSAALAEVERTESAYVQAIDKLAADAKPQLDNPATPLLANYREKLLVLDSAIGELRAQAEQNPGNAHLRRELLAMYQEKQSTLQGILEDKQR
jgi:hypothetical protein